MRTVPKSPELDWSQVAQIGPKLTCPDVQDYVTDANKKYYHWEEIRYRKPPVGLSVLEAWQAIAASRFRRMRLPLTTAEGVPYGFWLPDQALQWIHQIDRKAGIAQSEPSFDSDQIRTQMVIDSLMEEAIATSQIEGAATTRKVAKEMLRTRAAPRNEGEHMIANGYQTISMIRDRLDEPLSLDLLHDIQESMTRNTLDDPHDARRIRTQNDNVRVIDIRDQEDVYVPPPAIDLPARLKRLVDFANADSDASPFVHPVVRAAILHFWLAYEHPYVDGNGRTARALFYWYMLKQKYWAFEYLSISRIIHASPRPYYRAFVHAERDSNDLTYFVMYQLRVTHQAIEKMRDHVQKHRQESQKITALRTLADLNDRQNSLLLNAVKNPDKLYTIDAHKRSQGVSTETARSDLLILTAKGLLTEVGGRRPRIFMAAKNLARKLKLK